MGKAKNKGKNAPSSYLNRPYSLSEIEVVMENIVEPPYQERQFEDSHFTKFLHEQLMLIRLTINLLAIISILLSFMSSMVVLGQTDKFFLLIIHTVISVGVVLLVSFRHFKSIEYR